MAEAQRLARYDRPLLADSSHQEELRRAGYLVLPPRVGEDELRALHTVADDLFARLEEPWGDEFLALGRVADAALRAEITDAAGAVVGPHLEPLFVASTEILSAALQIKPPSPGSQLDPHQDSSLVDELAWLGVYCWMPLVDTGPDNGWLQVVPGSHRLGNLHRTLNVPWAFEGQADVLRRHAIGLAVPAGGLVLFDSATVHGSPPNRSGDVRLALNSFAKPAEAPMVHLFRDDATTPGMVEAWEIGLSFFLDEDIMARPPAHYPSLGERPFASLSLSDEELDARCTALVADAGARPVAGAEVP